MKKFIAIVTVFFLALANASGQGVAISDQTNPSVATGAVLDVSSAPNTVGGARGFLPPRIASEKYAVSSKTSGLLYYFTNSKSYGYYTPQGWCSFVISGPYTGEDVDPTDPVVQNVMFTPLGGLAIKLTNKSGGTLSKGMLVQVSASGDNAVTKASGTDAMGVVYEDISIDAEGWIVVSGVAEVLHYDGTPALGDKVRIHSSQSGYGEFSATSSDADLMLHSREIGYCIKAASTGILARVILQF